MRVTNVLLDRVIGGAHPILALTLRFDFERELAQEIAARQRARFARETASKFGPRLQCNVHFVAGESRRRRGSASATPTAVPTASGRSTAGRDRRTARRCRCRASTPSMPPRYAALRTVPRIGRVAVAAERRSPRGRIDTSTAPSGRPRCGSDSVTAPRRTSAVRASRRVERAAHAIGVAHEAGDERVARLLVELARRAFLRDHRLVHHDDAVGHRHRFRLVVRDVDDGERQPLLQIADFLAHLAAQAARRDSTAARRTAALPARAPARARRRRAAAGRRTAPTADASSKPVEADRRRARACALVGLRPSASATRRGRSATFSSTDHVRKQRVALEHHRHVALGGGRRA